MKTSNEEFQIKHLGRQDVAIFQKLITVLEEAFEIKNSVKAKESYLKTMLGKPEFIAYAVLHKNEVIGGLTAYELQSYYSEQSEMFIYDIAVKPEFKRKGLGKKLMSALEQYCRQNDIKVMFVEAYEEDEQAVKFYNSTGAKAEKVVHFNYELISEKVF